MRLTPRYGSTPLISLDGDPAPVGAAFVAQQRRFVEALGTLDADGWAHPSRCDGWSARDVIVHLESATGFWVLSLAQGLTGEPSRFLADFDPVATPASLAAASDLDGPRALERLTATAESLASTIEDLDAEEWSRLVEAPPGHVTVGAMVHHALWDSWVHERDVLVPQGRSTVEDPVEVAAALRYVAALSPALAVSTGTARAATLAVDAEDPDVTFCVTVGDVVEVTAEPRSATPTAELSGAAVGLLEALSRRAPLDAAIPAEASWLVDGLATAFDQT